MKIAIIGGGNLGSAIAEGLLYSKTSKAADIRLTRRNLSSLTGLGKKGVKLGSDNVLAVKEAEMIFLCVKPFQAREVLTELAPAIQSGHILVSMVSGISTDEIKTIIKKAQVLRAMPNTAIALAESMTCVSGKNDKACAKVLDVFNRLGKAIVIDEKLMDAATILGACGTAFALRFIRACTQGGIEIGFDARTASLIAAQTAKGAAELLLVNNSHPEQEIDKVTTPKGVTITGLNQMEHHGLSSSIIKGITESFKKMNH